MSEFDLKNYLSLRKQLVEAELEKIFPAPSGLQKKVVEAARYSLFAGESGCGRFFAWRRRKWLAGKLNRFFRLLVPLR